MKIGIVGLKPRQVADLSSRSFEHEVTCMPNVDKRFSSTSVASFARDKDLVLILQQQVPKHILEGIPAKKRHTMAGSVSTVINYINGLDKPQPPAPAPLMHWSEHDTVKEDLIPMIRTGVQLDEINEAIAFLGVRPLKLEEFKRLRKQGNQLVLKVGKVPAPAKAPEEPAVETTPVPTKPLLTEAERQEVEEEQQMKPEVALEVEVPATEKTQLEALEISLADELAKGKRETLLPSDFIAGFPLPISLASDIPEGQRSQYLLPKHEILVNYPNSGGVHDYTILKAALPGDVLRFARPEGLTLRNWRNRITAMRYGYFRQHQLLIEAHFYQDYVDLKVMEKDDQVVNREIFSPNNSEEMQANKDAYVSLVREGRVLETEFKFKMYKSEKLEMFAPEGGLSVPYLLHDLGPLQEYVDLLRQGTMYIGTSEPTDTVCREQAMRGLLSAVSDNHPHYTFHSVNIDTTIHTDPPVSRETLVREMLDKAREKEAPKQTNSVEEAQFWRDVYLALLGQGRSVKDAGTGADEALIQHQQRFI